MAHLLAKLGKEALRPSLVDGVWRKAVVSAKNAARLRKEAVLEGRWVPIMRCTRPGRPPSPSSRCCDVQGVGL